MKISGIKSLRHPDCRSCDEYERLNIGERAKLKPLRHRAEEAEAQLQQLTSAVNVWRKAAEVRYALAPMPSNDRALIERISELSSPQPRKVSQ